MKLHLDRTHPCYCNLHHRHPRLRHSENPNEVDCERCLLQRERHPERHGGELAPQQ